MQTLKIVALGLLFSFIATIGYLLLGLSLTDQCPEITRPDSVQFMVG